MVRRLDLDRNTVVMPQATQAAFDARVGVDDERLTGAATAASGIRIALHGDLASVERDWRAFEKIADGTVFQSFDWVSLWQRHIGQLEGVRPVIVTGRDDHGQLLVLLALSIERRGLARRLTWLGTTLCDYNGPLLRRSSVRGSMRAAPRRLERGPRAGWKPPESVPRGLSTDGGTWANQPVLKGVPRPGATENARWRI